MHEHQMQKVTECIGVKSCVEALKYTVWEQKIAPGSKKIM